MNLPVHGWPGRPARAANWGGVTAGRCGCTRHKTEPDKIKAQAASICFVCALLSYQLKVYQTGTSGKAASFSSTLTGLR
jgi:hypothetical protein